MSRKWRARLGRDGPRASCVPSSPGATPRPTTGRYGQGETGGGSPTQIRTSLPPRPLFLMARHSAPGSWDMCQWDWELGDGVTGPHMYSSQLPTRFLPPFASAVDVLPAGSTAVLTLPAWTAREAEAFDHVGHKIPWSGNQHSLVTDLVRALDGAKGQRFVWVVLETRQKAVAEDPIMTMQLDGRGIIRMLRKKAIMLIYDKSGRMYRFTDHGPERTDPWTTYHFAFLLDSASTWKPITEIRSAFVTGANPAQGYIAFTPMSTFRILVPGHVENEKLFYKWVNDSPSDARSTSARQDSVLPWAGARRLPDPEDNRKLFEYEIPTALRETLTRALQHEDEEVLGLMYHTQYIDLTDMSDVYVIFQAKIHKTPTTSSIGGPEDLETELYMALGFDQGEPLDRGDQDLRMIMPEVFPQGVPHMRFQRLVKVTNTSLLTGISRKLWQGAGLVIKKMDTDKRVRFGGWSRSGHNKVTPLPPLQERQAYFTTPANMPEEDCRKVCTLFGTYTAFAETKRTVFGRTTWLVEYADKDSAGIADGAVVDTLLGEVEVQGTPMAAEDRELMKNAMAAAIPEDQKDEDQDWWRWHMGKLLGSETALAEENRKVTPNNLHSLQH